MFKIAIKQRQFLSCCVFLFFFFAIIQVSVVHAATHQTQLSHDATPTVTLSQPGQNGNAIGHPNTKVTIALASFTPNSPVNLYTVTDPAQCTAANAPNLQSFDGYAMITTDGSGGKTLNNISWATSANVATTAYYICAISPVPVPAGLKAVSPQSFTVAQAVTASTSSPTIQPGAQLTIQGQNWLPSQQLTIAVLSNRTSGQNNILVQTTSTSDNNGIFSVVVTIPDNATPGTYAISVVATNEPTMIFEQDSLVTVVGTTPTPTPAPSPTPSPTASPTVSSTATATTTPTTTTSGGGGSGLTVLIFALGGVGILMIVIGVIMFAASSPTVPVR